MPIKPWGDQAVDEILDFLQANVTRAVKSRKRVATQNRALTKKVDRLMASIDQTSQDLQILQQKIEALDTPAYAPFRSVVKL